VVNELEKDLDRVSRSPRIAGETSRSADSILTVGVLLLQCHCIRAFELFLIAFLLVECFPLLSQHIYLLPLYFLNTIHF
jgi:hypothetical protein